MKRLALAAAAALVVLAACGGSSDESSEAFCTEFEKLMDTAQNSDQTTPEGMEKAVNATLEANEKMAEALPSDQEQLKEDLESQLEVYREIATLLEDAGYDQSKIDTEKYQEVLAKTSDFSDTQTQLLEYAQDNCDIDLQGGSSTTGPPAEGSDPATSAPPADSEQ